MKWIVNLVGTEAKNDFEKDFFKLMNDAVFGKTMENLRKHRDIKLITTERRRTYLMLEPNNKVCHRASVSNRNEKKKTEILMNKPVNLGLSILCLSKTLMYEFWYDYIKPKYSEKANLCYMDTNSFIIHVKTEDIYKDIKEDVDKWFETSNYDVDRLLSVGKKK